MRHFVFRWAITTVAVLIAASVINGIRYDSVGSLIGAWNMLLLLMAPLIILTLGIFIFVVNGLMLLLVNDLVHGFHVDSFGSAFWGAILISFVSWILSAFFRGSDGRVHPLTHHRQMRRVEGRVVASSKQGESRHIASGCYAARAQFFSPILAPAPGWTTSRYVPRCGSSRNRATV